MKDFYKIRIDTSDRESIQTMCDRYFDAYIYAFEEQEGTNPHCHLYVEMFTKQRTLREHIRQTFGRGNRCYSMKSLDEKHPIEYLAYAVKCGNYTSKNIPEEVLKEAVEYDKKIKLMIKEKKASRDTIYNKVCQEYGDRMKAQEYDPVVVIASVLDYYKDRSSLFREFFATSVIQTILLKNNPDYTDYLKRRIFERILNIH